jgi:glycosyltransferase involved in cell wall biosynthesis
MSTSTDRAPVLAHGKFFSRAGSKFFFKAVRLEPLKGEPDLTAKLRLRRRFGELREAHTTAIVVKEADAETVIDLAAQAGLCAMVEIAIQPNWLLERREFELAQARISRVVRSIGGHPALLGYLLDCSIGPDLLKAEGIDTIGRSLRLLIEDVRCRDARALVAVKHNPSTRGAIMLEEDFIYSTVPPLSLSELGEYIIGLHNLAEARPVVVEFERPTPAQEEQVALAFGMGAAGAVARPLVRRVTVAGALANLRALNAEELLPFVSLNGNCPPQPVRAPMVSVVICAYNAERTMHACLESLRKLHYPNFEVVIVDDGSRDRTAEIAKGFPEFRLIRQPNKGLSVARNVGMQAARGEIIAYTDSDCVVDPHWLTMMVRAMQERGFDGCGGPNYAPHENGRLAACVAASPGAPCHVLVGPDRAEHLAGCNMVFRKAALLSVGGFDPQFTSAGDDVDICWRLLDAGFSLGYCPPAFVWHFRRNTVRAYYGQQRGYGRAEVLLYAKYPERFNALGQIRWQGTIPGLLRTIPGGNRPRVLWNAETVAAQTVHEPAMSIFGFLPQTMEWNALGAVALIASISAGITVIPAVAMLALGPTWALYYAWHAPLEKCHESFAARITVAWLAYSGPMVRTITRYKLKLKARTAAVAENEPRQRPELIPHRLALRLSYWNESYTSRDALVERIGKTFGRAGYLTVLNGGWKDFDLEVRTSALSRIELKTADEEHGGLKLRNLVLVRSRMSRLAGAGLFAGVSAAAMCAIAGLTGVALALAGATFVLATFIASDLVEAAQIAYRAVEQAAAELQMIPLGAATRPHQGERASARKPARAVEFAENPPPVD